MNRFDQAIREAKEAMVSAGQLPRQIMPNRQHLETDDFFVDIHWSATNGGEYVAKLTYKNAEDLGRVEEVRAPSRDALMLELMRQNASLKVEEQELQAPLKSKVHIRLADFDSPEHMLQSVEQGATARNWLQTPTGQMYARLERASNSDRPYEILKEEMVRLGFWNNPVEFNEANLSYAFVNALNDGKFSYFEKRADRRDLKAADTANADAEVEFEQNAPNPYLHVNNRTEVDETSTEELRAVKELPFKELRRRAVAERYANKR